MRVRVAAAVLLGVWCGVDVEHVEHFAALLRCGGDLNARVNNEISNFEAFFLIASLSRFSAERSTIIQ